MATETDRLILRAWRHMKARHQEGHTVQLGDMVTPLGPHAAALGAGMLATPFLWPLSLGPFTAPASALMILLAACLWIEATAQDLPDKIFRPKTEGGISTRLREWLRRLLQKFLAAPIPAKALPAIRKLLRAVIGIKRRMARPRPGLLVDGSRGRVLCAIGIALGAMVLAIPIPVVPLLNTVSAMAIILFTIAFAERDRVVALLAWLTLVIAAVANVGALVLILMLGREAFLRLIGLAESAATATQ